MSINEEVKLRMIIVTKQVLYLYGLVQVKERVVEEIVTFFLVVDS